MAKILIWPDLYREHGHWLPCVSLANSLEAAGHEVAFMGIPDCRSIVSPYSAPYTSILSDIYPLGYSVENHLEPLGQRWKPHHLLPICDGALDSFFADPPDLLVAGYFTALETLMIRHRYNQRVAIITTYLRHPEKVPSMHAKLKLVYMTEAMRRKIVTSVTPDGAEMSLEQFVRPLEICPELIPCPRDFDFVDDDWVHDETVHYVEPMISRGPLGGNPPPSNMPGANLPTNKRIIFATSGSQVQDYETRARELFKNLIAMMQTPDMDDYHLVLAVGPKILVEFNKIYGVGSSDSSLPNNVTIFDWVSQLDVVRAADVIFTHGGLATIKESIAELVPIVLIPHGKDQLDNALRIKRAGLGLVAQADAISPLQLRSLLVEATTSRWIRSNLQQMKAKLDAQEGAASKPSVEALNTWLASTRF